MKGCTGLYERMKGGVRMNISEIEKFEIEQARLLDETFEQHDPEIKTAREALSRVFIKYGIKDIIEKNKIEFNKATQETFDKFKNLITKQYNKSGTLPIRYYNLDVSNVDEIDEFLVMFVAIEEFYQFGYEVPNLMLYGSISKENKEFLLSDHKVFKGIVNKILKKEKLSDEEINHIQSRITPIITQHAKITKQSDSLLTGYWNEESLEGLRKLHSDLKIEHWSLFLYCNYPNSNWLHGIYKDWIIDLSLQRIKIQRCQLEGCDNIFEVKPGGHPQKYCSDAHKMKAYRERKNKLITV